MKTLIGMVTFVLEQENNPNEYNPSNKYKDCLKYANFLSHQPQLSDFVPCGKDGLPLTEPEYYEYHEKNISYSPTDFGGFFDDFDDWKQWKHECIIYQQALDKVLFKGFEVVNYPDIQHGITKTVSLKNTVHAFHYDSISQTWNKSLGIKSLESLTSYNLELTDNALNLI